MANPNFDRDKAAKILLDASLMGDRAAGEKWGVTVQTISRYRTRAESDSELLKAVNEKKRIQDAEWASEIPAFLTAGIQFLKEAAQQCDRRDPDSVHAIAGAIKIVAEVEQIRKVIDARLANQD